MKKIIITIVSIALTALLIAQASVDQNTSANTNHFLGWNSAPFDLNIRHNQNFNINFWTNSTERMRLWKDNTVTLGSGSSFNTINQGGKLGIFASPMTSGPFSLLHFKVQE